jgi:hypothetical protein
MEEVNFLHAYSFASLISEGIAGIDPDFTEISDYIDTSSPEIIIKLSKPHKNTVLHELIDGLVLNHHEYLTSHYLEEGVDYLESIFKENNLPIPTWLNEDDISFHRKDLEKMLPSLTAITKVTAFHLLFSDRNFCFRFQTKIAEQLSQMNKNSQPHYFQRDGVLKRPTYSPPWLRSAIFHRDKGICQLCWKDMTGLRLPLKNYQLDHMIPLAASGSNDPTNFQLVCPECNKTKGKKPIAERQKIVKYW